MYGTWSPVEGLYIQQLLAVLSEDLPVSPSNLDGLLFDLLLELEMRAEREHGGQTALAVIARVRRLAGQAASRPLPALVGEHEPYR